MKAYWGSGGIAPRIRDIDTRWIYIGIFNISRDFTSIYSKKVEDEIQNRGTFLSHLHNMGVKVVP
jgi:hypothetical protein